MMIKKYKRNRGFTLIEIMVSLSVFIVIMTVSMGSILSIIDSNSKSQNKKTAMDNLNFALESMSRTVRFGTNYYCGTTSNNPPASGVDCINGGNSITFITSENMLVVYALSGGRITKNGNPITSPEINISRLRFHVVNSTLWPDLGQPRVTMVVSGSVGNKVSTQSNFSLQTLMSQRKLDI